MTLKLVNVVELSELLEIPERTLYRYIKDLNPYKTKGREKLYRASTSIRFLLGGRGNRNEEESSDDITELRKKDLIASARAKHAKADHDEIEANIKLGKLHDAEECNSKYEGIFETILANLDGIPAQFSKIASKDESKRMQHAELILEGVKDEIIQSLEKETEEADTE